MTIHKEIKVGLLVVVSLVMLYTGFNFLKGIDFFSSQNSYYAIYEDVNGLMIGNPVIVNGLSVGRVSDISILPNDNHKLRVDIDIEKDIFVSDSSYAMISSTDLLGTKCVRLILGNSKTRVESKSEIRGMVEPSFTDKLSEQANPIVHGLSNSLDQLALLLSVQNIHTISNTLSELEKMLKQLNATLQKNDKSIENTLKNAESVSANLIQMQKALQPTLSNLQAVSDSLQKMPLTATIASAERAVSQLETTLLALNNGKGTLGKLATDDSLYIHLDKTIASLDALLVDLKKNPQRYVQFSVFGKKTK